VDPHTGIGLTNHSLVNVIAPNGITSDSLTKVVAVLPPAQSFKIIESTPGVAARLVRPAGGSLEFIESRRFKLYYEELGL
jgi:thiamine biosynthesis lipoprotein